MNTEQNESLPSLRRDTSGGVGCSESDRKNKMLAGGSDFTSAAIRNSQRERERDKAEKKRRNGSLTMPLTSTPEHEVLTTSVPVAIRDESSSTSSSDDGSGNGRGKNCAASWWEHRNIRCFLQYLFLAF